MLLVELLILILVAGIVGTVGSAIVGRSAGGCVSAIAIGLVGALLGAFLARTAGLPQLLSVSIGGSSFPFIWAIAGSALFVALLTALSPPARRRSARR